MAISENMELWSKYAEPPVEAKKSFDNGSFKGTDISPMWRIRCLTEEFGPCGFGWYPELVDHWERDIDGVPMVFVTLKLYINRNGEWSKPITATGGNSFVRKKGGKVSDEAYKMAFTDALGGCCKLLGIGGKVYWERGYSKYEEYYTKDAEPKPAEVPVINVGGAMPPYMDEPDEDIEYRILALSVYPVDKLDEACQNKFGTDFAHTPVSQLREVMPESMLNARKGEQHE